MTLELNHAPVTITCRVRAENVFIRVNNVVPDHNNFQAFRDRGINFSSAAHDSNGVARQLVTVVISEANNNTAICCIGTTSGFTHAVSDIAFIIIAGKELINFLNCCSC